jgi:hypothetical protein
MASCAIIAWGDRCSFAPGPIASTFLTVAVGEAVCLFDCLFDLFVCLFGCLFVRFNVCVCLFVALIV